MSAAPSDMFLGSSSSKMLTLVKLTEPKDTQSKPPEILPTDRSQHDKDSDAITVLQKELRISGEVIDRQSRQIHLLQQHQKRKRENKAI
jgi:hypothetical protein